MLQLHVLRGEEEELLSGRGAASGPQHIRVLCERTGALWRLAEGNNTKLKSSVSVNVWQQN